MAFKRKMLIRVFFNKVHVYFIILIAYAVLSGCTRTCKVNDIEVSELLKIYSDERGYNYCALLESSLDGNNKSIKDLSLLQIYNAAGYDHGAVLVDLIKVIGEEKYIEAIRTINNSEKQRIESYLDVGFLYGQNVDTMTVKNTFPRLYAFLSNANGSR